MSAPVFDHTQCSLGEGPLWHPERRQFFWFDINEKRMLTHENGAQRHWQWDEHVSAAGWIDRDTLLVASETALWRVGLADGSRRVVCPLEGDNAVTRSNDGRADPQGGFWIGTMGKSAEPGAGAIYRYHRGALRLLWDGITIPNAICFAPDGRHAYFTDTPTQVIRRVALDADGWPDGAAEAWLDLTGTEWKPDGAVCDADGNLWNAQYGGARVACYDPQGRFLRALPLPASQATCPAFGGPDLTTLFCTTAAQGLSAETLALNPEHGKTFALPDVAKGQAEHRVIL